MKLHDTIAAIATPVGSGGIAILRLSGLEAESIAGRVVTAKNGKPLPQFESHKLTLCTAHKTDDTSSPIDEALVAVMRAPHSYTGETVVEINCHGGFFAAGRILEELLSAGARLAEGGEFTRRAFLNGKTDLTGAEAVMDIIDSSSGLGLQNAARVLNGSLADKINSLRESVITVTSHISAAADYPEEVDPPAPAELAEQLGKIKADTAHLLGTFETGRLIKEGITTVIAGRPNVGKSSLLNALSRSDRAIVTDIPGTTRDIIEEYIQIGGISLKLIDTAGIRQSDDEVERLGIERAVSRIAEADLCLFVVDASDAITDEDREIARKLHSGRTILLLNKLDKGTAVSAEAAEKELGIPKEFILQTATPGSGQNIGIDRLEAAISDMFLKGRLNPGEVYISSTRQRDSLLKAADALTKAIDGVCTGIPYDLLYIDLEDALSALGEVTGVTVQEEIIDNVFARFCVGK